MQRVVQTRVVGFKLSIFSSSAVTFSLDTRRLSFITVQDVSPTVHPWSVHPSGLHTSSIPGLRILASSEVVKQATKRPPRINNLFISFSRSFDNWAFSSNLKLRLKYVSRWGGGHIRRLRCIVDGGRLKSPISSERSISSGILSGILCDGCSVTSVCLGIDVQELG